MPSHPEPVAAPREPGLYYEVDAADRLSEVGGSWSEFSDANAGSGLDPASVVGRLLWDYVGDPTTRELYRAMLKRVRHDALPVRFRFRCDSPTVRRLLAMELSTSDDAHVQFGVELIRLETRAAVPLLEVGHDVRSGEFLTMCGWCQNVRLPDDRWVAVEEAVSALGLFDDVVMPQVSHGICPSCHEQLNAMLDDAELAVAGSVTLGNW